MGGVAGHMDHLYDNRNLTFAKMKEIMQAGADAELSTEEKVDGQNLFLSYSIPEGKAKGARNKGNLRGGGLDATALAQKFAGRGGLEKAFNSGFSAFEKAVEALSDKEKQRIFGSDTNIWYNAEIMDPGTEGDPNDPGSVNVIKYDDKTLKIHNVGHFVFDRESGEKEPIPEGALETLDNAYDRMQQALHGHDFSIARKAIIELQKLEDQDAVQTAFSKINSALSAEELSDNSTIGEYLFTRLVKGLDTDLSESTKEEIAKYLLDAPDSIGKRALKKDLKPEDRQDIDDIVKNKRMILKAAILPIEMAVHEYTVEILKGLKSVFISDTDKEVQRLKTELSKAVEEITAKGPEDPESMQIMQFHLNKIKDFSQITTPVEAVVFDYDGHTYKFAGNFAPLNQILGMYRYPKAGKKIATESLTKDAKPITNASGKKVALLPGGFKPPHAGHYGLAKLLAAEPGIDEVIVIVGKNPRFSEVEPKIEITAQQSKNLWDLYTRKDENIKVRIQEGKTPVADVYDLIADKSSFSEGDVVVLGKSDKDVGDRRYDRAQSWAERNNPGVNVEEMVFPVIGGKNMGGTTLRNIIADGKKEVFFSMLPEHLNEKEKQDAWMGVTSSFNETFNNLVDDQIDEMSSMAAGSVEIGVGAFGVPNSYNPYSRRKNKKPKVKRAKRQRRR